jgi:uncharacterized protein YbjT (DUF2867 family)
MVLVVGATGQVGNLIVSELVARGRPVRALVRSARQAEDLRAAGADVVPADLREPASLDAAVDGQEAIVATANVVAPSRPGDTSRSVEERGYEALVERAVRAGVRRFVYTSAPASALDDQVPQMRAKRVVERHLAESGLSAVSLRLAPFTEVWLALVGSALPVQSERLATVDRPYRFLRAFRRLSGTTIEDHGVLVLPGPATKRHAFISVHDVARVVVAALDAPELTGPVQVGGPEVLSWRDVAQAYAEVLGRRVRILSVPGAVFGVAQTVLTPVAPAAANIMGLNRLMAATNTDWDSSAVLQQLGVQDLQTVRDVLYSKREARSRR